MRVEYPCQLQNPMSATHGSDVRTPHPGGPKGPCFSLIHSPFIHSFGVSLPGAGRLYVFGTVWQMPWHRGVGLCLG